MLYMEITITTTVGLAQLVQVMHVINHAALVGLFSKNKVVYMHIPYSTVWKILHTLWNSLTFNNFGDSKELNITRN